MSKFFQWHIDPKLSPMSESAAKFLSAENTLNFFGQLNLPLNFPPPKIHWKIQILVFTLEFFCNCWRLVMLQNVAYLANRQSSVGDLVCLLRDFDFCDCFTVKISDFGEFVSFSCFLMTVFVFCCFNTSAENVAISRIWPYFLISAVISLIWISAEICD